MSGPSGGPGVWTEEGGLGELEHFFCCPHCWSTISMLLEPGVEAQRYIEDCEICCQPIQIDYSIQPDGSIRFQAEAPS